MAEKVKTTGVSKESGYLYYLDKGGNVARTKMARGANKGGGAEVVAQCGVSRESDGYTSSIKMVMFQELKWLEAENK